MESKNFIAISPGMTIREQLEDRGMSHKEFAGRMDLSEKHVSNLINGKVELTCNIALRLESVLGIPAQFWLNKENLYREQLARVKADLEIANDIEIAKKMPYSKGSAFGWVPKTRKAIEKAYNLRKYFEVAYLETLEKLQPPGIACGAVRSGESIDYALVMWAQQARIQARTITVDAIDLNLLQNQLLEIRALTKTPATFFCDELRCILANCGVALVFLPHIGGSYLHGATFYDGRHIVLGLTVRGRDADRFWFSLFHELGHIVLRHIGRNYNEAENKQAEDEADAFAQDTLIPFEQYKAFVEKKVFNKQNIIAFAHEIDIAPGIVVGRLQRDQYVRYDQLHELKEQYVISE